MKLIYGYMGFATFMIFFIMTGGIALDLLQTLKLRMDILSLMFILYNFAVVGSTILFFTPAPLLLKQVCSIFSSKSRGVCEHTAPSQELIRLVNHIQCCPMSLHSISVPSTTAGSSEPPTVGP